MSAKKKSSKEDEPNWKEIAEHLWRDVEFAICNLKSSGSGAIYNPTAGQMRHWKTRFADNLERWPGIKIDREIMWANDLPKKRRDKEIARILREREEAKQTEAPAP